MLIELKAIEGTLGNKRKRTHSEKTLNPTPLLHHLFVPSLPTPGTMDTDFVDTFLAFRKGAFLLITTFLLFTYFYIH